MGINLMKDLGFDESDVEVIKAREAADIYDRLIDALVSSREQMCLKQKDVAVKMQTSQSAVSDLENRNGDARFSTILRYAQAVGAEIEIQVCLPMHALRSAKHDWVTLDVVDAGLTVPERSRRPRPEWAHVLSHHVVQLPTDRYEEIAA